MKNVVENTVISENYTFFTGDAQGQVTGGEYGLYNRDTRVLSRYTWTFPEGTQTLQVHSPRPDKLQLRYGMLDKHRQLVGVARNLHIGDGCLNDELKLENQLLEPQMVKLELDLDADFADLFEVRGWPGMEREVARDITAEGMNFSYTATDGLDLTTTVSFSQKFELRDDQLVFTLELPPKGEMTLGVKIEVENPLEIGAVNPVSYEAWRENFTSPSKGHGVVLARAVDDLRALMLFDEAGMIPAAGLPWFAAAFGRDSLLTAHLLLPYAPEVAVGTLRYLARHQATQMDDFRAAQPGKILHERRTGELSRTHEMPFSPYYGTIDATPLFVMLLGAHFEQEGNLELVRELRPHWEAALNWTTEHGDIDGDGFLEFVGAERGQEGLFFQSWKDSEDSMSHADGELAWGKVAVCEAQGYMYAAYRAAASFYRILEEPSNAEYWKQKAETLKSQLHQAFWLEDLGTYAMALDGEKRPLKVHNSGAGHLLWCGAATQEAAVRLAESLMNEENWTGWGLRTLGINAARYNPVSYHNGSVWPHDTALIARGLADYGFKDEARQIAQALMDLTASQHDLRPPELIAGYSRTDAPPVPYPTACRPQAWSSAALVGLTDLLQKP